MKTGEYQSFRDKLARQLLDYTDPESGEQIVTNVLAREEVYSGPALEKAPDLLLTLSDQSFVSVVNEEPVVLKRPKINGTHRPEGIFIFNGPAVRRGEIGNELSILDVAPTVLYSLGLPIPGEFEGCVTQPAFTDEHVKNHPVVISEDDTIREPVASSKTEKSPFSKEEEGKILARLRDLGYL